MRFLNLEAFKGLWWLCADWADRGWKEVLQQCTV